MELFFFDFERLQIHEFYALSKKEGIAALKHLVSFVVLSKDPAPKVGRDAPHLHYFLLKAVVPQLLEILSNCCPYYAFPLLCAKVLYLYDVDHMLVV